MLTTRIFMGLLRLQKRNNTIKIRYILNLATEYVSINNIIIGVFYPDLVSLKSSSIGPMKRGPSRTCRNLRACRNIDLSE